ncbi:Hypothetical predicted protein [Drosophila guanche]|uniref:Uncharacterized protein n=1 Tax=Drosophila guanche TaxID=7266 RepID=A0A3B0KL73_DROGU|nr:Hypothetical predicted protein [Drosophila guanche]
MISPLVALCLVVGMLLEAHPSSGEEYTLCTFDTNSYGKCLAMVRPPRMQIGQHHYNVFQGRRCLETVKNEDNHYVVLDHHDYMAAREAGLRPVIFAREERKNFIIAVKP